MLEWVNGDEGCYSRGQGARGLEFEIILTRFYGGNVVIPTDSMKKGVSGCHASRD